MTIRNRLTFQFVLIASLLLGAASLAVYLQSALFRREEFYNRLSQRAENTVQLLIQVNEVNPELLRKIEKSTLVRLPDEGMRMFDHHGTELYQSGNFERVHISPELIERVKQEREVRYKTGEDEVYGSLFHIDGKDYTIYVQARDHYGQSKLFNLLRMLLITNAVAAMIMLFIGRYYARQALEPLRLLVNEVKALDEATLAKRIGEGAGKDEIDQLAQSFNDLLARLEAAFQNQQQFIANASHELRTPLTSISGQLEVLMLKERDLPEYRSTITSVMDDLHSLSSMTTRLLLMAQSGRTAAADLGPLRIDEAVWSAWSEILKRHPQYRVQVSIPDDVEAESLNILGSDQLIRTMTLNLIDNACKYSNDHAAVVSIEPGATEVILSVIDKGIGIPQLDIQNIMEPFFRASNTASVRGHGLGLSMVKRIVEMHNGTLSIQSVQGEGTKVTVSIPIYKPV